MTVFVTKHEHIQIAAVLQFPTSVHHYKDTQVTHARTSVFCSQFSLLFKLTQFIYLQICMHAHVHAHTCTHRHTQTHTRALTGRLSCFCSESSIRNSKKLFGYRSQHICTQNSTYSQDLITFMIFLKPL
jgi:hypothetical protein